MMNPLIRSLLLFSVSTAAFARPVVLISYYDVFGKGTFNNSENVARGLGIALQNEPYEISFCKLPTAYDRSYAAVESCLKNLNTVLLMYLGLGEFGCSVKMETIARNFDKNPKLPDNDGNLRNDVIIPEAPKAISFNYPAPEMYCALSTKERGDMAVSNSAGSFVCNNTAFQFAHYYPEIPAGFIHVPANNCRNLDSRTSQTVRLLATMVRKAVVILDERDGRGVKLPLTRNELEPIRAQKKDLCTQEYFKRFKSVEEIGFWSFLGG
jgi:pyroglutamyl-peptidase